MDIDIVFCGGIGNILEFSAFKELECDLVKQRIRKDILVVLRKALDLFPESIHLWLERVRGSADNLLSSPIIFFTKAGSIGTGVFP